MAASSAPYGPATQTGQGYQRPPAGRGLCSTVNPSRPSTATAPASSRVTGAHATAIGSSASGRLS